jgi:cyclic pyranopterin phosphate synthase
LKSAHLTHLDSRGEARMVDVSQKAISLRVAQAVGRIRLQAATIQQIQRNRISKGNVLATARLAGIQAAKRTGELIPLCHPLAVEHLEVEFRLAKREIEIKATARIMAKTGVEMEALTAVALAALTIYDMCKAVDKTMAILDVHLLSKTKTPLP